MSGIPTFDQVRCGVAIPAALLILYSVGVYCDRRRSIVGLLSVLAGMVFLSFTDAVISPDVLGFVVPLCVGVWTVGLVVRSRNRIAAELAARSQALERQRERTARLAVELERTRLAAQLDVATRRRVREMLELTERGKQALASEPDRLPEAFAQIESAGRASLNEMRSLLGVLRSEPEQSRAPQPTLAQLSALLAAVRARGSGAELAVEGERRPLPNSVEVAAYRIVEHALASADGPVRVCLRYLQDGLELEVTGARGGDVLAAARERVSAHGGSLAMRGRSVMVARLPVAVVHA